MKLRVVSEEVSVRPFMWVVSVSAGSLSCRAMFEDEKEARAYAKDLDRTYVNVRVVCVNTAE